MSKILKHLKTQNSIMAKIERLEWSNTILWFIVIGIICYLLFRGI